MFLKHVLFEILSRFSNIEFTKYVGWKIHLYAVRVANLGDTHHNIQPV